MIIEQESAQIGYGPAKRDPQGLLMTQLARDALAIVLAGGRGSRLGPLTDWRAKPAVPFGGKFRIIDFSLSNCVNSAILKPPSDGSFPVGFFPARSGGQTRPVRPSTRLASRE